MFVYMDVIRSVHLVKNRLLKYVSVAETRIFLLFAQIKTQDVLKHAKKFYPVVTYVRIYAV